MDKKEKRKKVAQVVDLRKKRLRETEVDKLYDIIENSKKYNGKSVNKPYKYTDFSSDGKYTRKGAYIYTLHSDGKNIRIDERDYYRDDDGQTYDHTVSHTDARDILTILKTIFGSIL